MLSIRQMSILFLSENCDNQIITIFKKALKIFYILIVTCTYNYKIYGQYGFMNCSIDPGDVNA
jgi:hypothetical protein